MTPEGKVKRKIREWLKHQGYWAFAPIGGAYSTRGIPDIVACVHGILVAIEVKAPGRKSSVTDLQAYQLDAINQAGGLAFVASSVEEVADRIRALSL